MLKTDVVILFLFIQLLHDPRRYLVMCFLAVCYHLWIRSSCFLCFRPNSTNIVTKQIIWALAVWTGTDTVMHGFLKTLKIIKKDISQLCGYWFLKNFTCIYYKLISQSLMLKPPASSSCMDTAARRYPISFSSTRTSWASTEFLRSSTNKALLS